MTADEQAVLDALTSWPKYRAPYLGYPVRQRTDRLLLDELAARSRLTERATQEAVRLLRVAGHPIASDQHGYWLATSAEEIAECRRSLTGRLRTQRLSIVGLWRAERRLRAARQGYGADGTLWSDL
jgi:NADPH-dependent ferric siderophore reductase